MVPFKTPFFLALLSCVCALARAEGEPVKRVETKEFGKLPDGTIVEQFVLRNSHGMVAKIITYGAILTELQAPDRTGTLTNVVLGADRFDAYLRGFPASAAIIGRYANRIAKARFTLHGVEYKLAANNGPNHIHGGNRGFAQRVWKAKVLPVNDRAAAVELTYASKDGEEGYPGNLRATITYTLTDDNELRLEYGAATDKATPINLTSHAYFNLAGFGDVLGHRLWLAAKKYTPVDSQLIPTGEIASVVDTPLDFNTPTLIGARIAQLKPPFGGYDHNYVLDNEAKALVLAARVTEPNSGRVMELRTTEPGVQLYTANHLGGRSGAGQPGYPKYGAFCLETQHYPDSVNQPSFPSTILEPGETYHSTTVFSFSAP